MIKEIGELEEWVIFTLKTFPIYLGEIVFINKRKKKENKEQEGERKRETDFI